MSHEEHGIIEQHQENFIKKYAVYMHSFYSGTAELHALFLKTYAFSSWTPTVAYDLWPYESHVVDFSAHHDNSIRPTITCRLPKYILVKESEMGEDLM